MVKRQKEKQYQTAHENRSNQQLRASGASNVTGDNTPNRGLLPFAHCALTLLPYETPVCNELGIIFDNAAVVKFMLRHKMDPVTGLPADSSKSLIRLNMDQNEEGAWQCPILTKPFSDRSKVIAIIQPGGERNEANVYSYEAYYELNVKPRNYEDLLTGEKFDKLKDVLTIFDPADDQLNRRRDISTFYHIRHARELLDANDESSDKVRHSLTATRVMETIRKNQAKEQQKLAEKKRKADSMTESTVSAVKYFKDGQQLVVLADDVTGVKYTEGQGGAATSLTSTVTNVSDQNRIREATEEEILTAQCNVMRNKLKKKGYVRMNTNFGTIALELHCDIAPRTCMNFLGLCNLGKYDNSKFHRLIPGFMIQGGIPSNPEDKEECLWGGSFPDEFDDRLQHASEGILSMANAGPNTNKQQFFLTFKSCPHLDRKHSVFGTVVEGIDVLKQLESIAVDKKERPLQEIKITTTAVLVDPAIEARELEQKRLEKLTERRQHDKEGLRSLGVAMKIDVSVEKPAVGRYLQQSQKPKDDSSKKSDPADVSVVARRLPPPSKNTKFGNFSGW
jgi:peptidyl-prolyl cis-trans isomerase-like 2